MATGHNLFTRDTVLCVWYNSQQGSQPSSHPRYVVCGPTGTVADTDLGAAKAHRTGRKDTRPGADYADYLLPSGNLNYIKKNIT